MSEVLTPEQVAEARREPEQYEYRVLDFCDTIDALRADNAILRNEQAGASGVASSNVQSAFEELCEWYCTYCEHHLPYDSATRRHVFVEMEQGVDEEYEVVRSKPCKATRVRRVAFHLGLRPLLVDRTEVEDPAVCA